MEGLKNKIKKKKAKIGVIGLGYVGLPLAAEFAQSGFNVSGFELDRNKIEKINKGISYIPDIKTDDIASLVKEKRLSATADFSCLSMMDVIFICVPTPFTKAKAPDISYIIAATNSIKESLKKGQLIILQSTTYPGTTEEVVVPILEETGFKADIDFFVAFSPERIDPGNKTWTIKNTPKVVGGLTEKSTEIACFLFSQIISEANVHPVSSPKSAELCKLLENTFRAVNIALVNELTLLCRRMGIDVWEVINAASTKPFGFMKFSPGPGVGGHCIPVDPFYLSWKAREFDFSTKFIELAAEINLMMPRYVVSLIASALNQKKKPMNGSKILVLGAAFKKDIDDYRNSPSEFIMELLLDEDVSLFYNDPYIPSITVKNKAFTSTEVSKETLKDMDCVVIATDHSSYNYKDIVQSADLVIDTRNATNGIENKEKIIRL
ncbi:MAG: nucleotide sugar dehydrogenase [bacterium]